MDHLSKEPPTGMSLGDLVTFGSHRGQAEWPHPPALVEAVENFLQTGQERLEPYYSAEDVETVANGAPVDKMQGLLEQLLAQSEVTQRTVSGMQDRLGSLPELQRRLEALEGHRQPSVQPPLQAAKSPQMFSPTGGKLDQSRLDVLQSLAGRGPSRVGDLGLGRGSKAPPPPSPFVAGTIEEGEEEDEDDLDGIPLTSGKNVLEKLLASQTLLLEKLASSKAAAQDPLRSLASSSSLDGDDGTKSLGVKGLAARQLLVENFRKHPAKVFQVFQERLTMARRKASKSELESRDLWLHMQESVPLGSHRTLTYVGFQAAAMYEAIERGEWDRVKMLVALQAVFVEQAAYDGGALRLGHLLTGLEDPPFAQTELHRVPKTDLPHGQLSDPRWLTAALGYLKDIESMGEKANRFTRGVNPSQSPQDDSADPAPKIKPKFRPKKPKRGSEGGGEE